MKPFNNCYVIKNNTKQTIKIISVENKIDFFEYVMDRLYYDNELTITTGFFDEKPAIKSDQRQDNVYMLQSKMLQ